MSRYSLNFKILTSRFPFKWNGANLLALMRAIRETLQDAVTKINAVYDTRYITYAAGTELDKWGEVLQCIRAAGESDTTYRARLLVAFRDLQQTLVIQAYKDAIEATTGIEPDCLEHYAAISGWPRTWATPLYGYPHLLTASFIVPDGLTAGQLNIIASDLQNVKLATLRVWLVEDKTTYYKIKKEIL